MKTQLQYYRHRLAGVNFLTMWFFAFAMVFQVTIIMPEYRPYAQYFLIGNVVIGAIIMWHLLVIPARLTGQSGKIGRKGRMEISNAEMASGCSN